MFGHCQISAKTSRVRPASNLKHGYTVPWSQHLHPIQPTFEPIQPSHLNVSYRCGHRQHPLCCTALSLQVSARPQLTTLLPRSLPPHSFLGNPEPSAGMGWSRSHGRGRRSRSGARLCMAVPAGPWAPQTPKRARDWLPREPGWGALANRFNRPAAVDAERVRGRPLAEGGSPNGWADSGRTGHGAAKTMVRRAGNTAPALAAAPAAHAHLGAPHGPVACRLHAIGVLGATPPDLPSRSTQ